MGRRRASCRRPPPDGATRRRPSRAAPAPRRGGSRRRPHAARAAGSAPRARRAGTRKFVWPRIERFLKRTAADASSDGRAGRLAEIDDGGARRSGLDGRCSGLAPQRVEDVARALAAERFLECRHEIVGPRRGGASHRRRDSRARSSPAALRPAATTRAAPSSFAVWTATRPTEPVAPSTSTFSPPASGARHANGSQPARPAIPSAAASAGSAPSGTSIACASPDRARSAIAPAAVRPSDPPKIQTTRPSSVRPTASQPGTYGSSGWPVARMPRETARSIGLIGAASTSTDSPAGSATSPTSGAPPTSRMSAALTRPRRSPRSRPSCRTAGCRRRPRSEHGPRRTPRPGGRSSR